MRRYIKAELNRNLKRPYFILMTLLVTLFAVALNVMGSTIGGEVYFSYSLDLLTAFFGLPIFLIIMIVDMVSMEEFKNGTIKNIVSSGLSREKIIISKMIVSCILGLIAAFVVIGIYILSARMLMPATGNMGDTKIYTDTIYRLVGVVPLWLGCVSVATFFTILIDKSFVSGFAYYIFLVVLPKVMIGLGGILNKPILKDISERFMMNSVIVNMGASLNISKDYIQGVIIGFGYLIIFGIISIIIFKKKDI